jgi:signal transduction histidine kinase
MALDEHTLARDDAHTGTGDLEPVFDAILQELERVGRESEGTHRQLMRRNRELAAIAAVAQATSTGQLDLAGMLQRALQVVLEVTGLPAGWVMLLPQDGAEPVLVGSAGLTRAITEEQARFRSPECECAKVLDTRRPLLVHPLHAACPIRALDLGNGRLPACHAAVPLLTRSKVVGVLNLAGDDPLSFDEQALTLLGAIGRQLGIAIENARLWEELKRRDELRGQLLGQAIAAQEDERRHIARELHDRTGQALTSLLVWLRALEAEADGSPGLLVSPARLLELKAIVAETLDGVHDLALELRPSVLDDLGLVPALQHTMRTCYERYHLAIDFQPLGLERVRLPPLVETALYRIVQEALTNVVQHACAKRVSLLLEARAGAVMLIVEDDGCGFEADQMVRGSLPERWLGLSGMRERAELLGGQLTIESAPGAGTTVFVEMPLDRERGTHGG